MDLGWLPSGWFRGRPAKVARARDTRKNKSGTFSAITLGAAAIALLLALFGIGPFAVQAVVFDFGPNNSGPLPAAAVFPTVSPTQRIVDVFDPPKPVGSSRPPATSPAPAPSPSPRPSHSPRPTPSPDH